jgi:steroid 5-alpha reductase family enzyme
VNLEWLLALNFVVLMGLVLFVWLVSLPLRDASIMDVAWGLGFVAVAWISCLAAGGSSWRSILITMLTTIWGLRLASYLAWRKFGQPEDYRYRALRQQFDKRFWLVSLPLVFGLQGVLLWVVSLPIPLAMISGAALNTIDALGVGLWSIGLIFETVGDWQLSRFKANPANQGQVFDGGLWRYTRHPNYFGDFLVWWGLYLIAVAGSSAWWTIVSPVLMSVLLLRVSGVALLEKSLTKRTTGYREYVTRTSSFFPWPPRKTKESRAGDSRA